MQEILMANTLKPLQRVALVALGWTLALVGIAGLLLPIVPEVFLIVAGALMLSRRSAWLRRGLETCRLRFPVLERAFRRFSVWGESRQSRRRNNPDNSGSQFKSLNGSGFSLRVTLERSKMGQRLQQNIDPSKTLPGMRKVLIFDQDIEDLARHAEPFESHGFEVHKCMSVEAAMRSVEREEFDFALVDQGSPTFEGLPVIRHLLRYDPHTPFVVMTRCRDALSCRQALALGAVHYLEKPVSGEEMNWIIKNSGCL